MVFLKGSDSRERLTFTLAHELGHIILNHSCSNESYVREEQEANFFASYLLMPDIIARILFSPVSPQDVMGFCGVTASCAWEMCRRINRVYKGKYEIKDYEFRIIEAFFIQENLKAKNRLDLREIS
ncbi:ImmA/IrrE family metallo-endopeptidase [Mobiluncus holmesii]|uniref:ImmA/IrrE family metallo-endopeptidase n=2 Tax=Actinomycetaceae TaxID=2049 RepID=A0A7K0K5M2_9ACTO|nr:ImmA/IrrE family metallo-endopeptidase [Mobiluncus porci]